MISAPANIPVHNFDIPQNQLQVVQLVSSNLEPGELKLQFPGLPYILCVGVLGCSRLWIIRVKLP